MVTNTNNVLKYITLRQQDSLYINNTQFAKDKTFKTLGTGLDFKETIFINRYIVHDR